MNWSDFYLKMQKVMLGSENQSNDLQMNSEALDVSPPVFILNSGASNSLKALKDVWNDQKMNL